MTPVQRWLVDQWGEENARTLQAMADIRPTTTCESLDLDETEVAVAALDANAAIVEVHFTCGTDAVMWLALPEIAVQALGGRTLTAAGVEDAGPEEIRNTCLEIVQQAHSGLAQAISRRVQHTVGSKGIEATRFPSNDSIFRLELSFPESEPVLTYLMFSEGLLAALEEGQPESAVKPGELSVAEEYTPTNVTNSKTFDILLEVSMPVSVSFGRTEMLIKEVLKLTTGSIVELNRNVTEPVDVIVNDRVIARGEVVVVDGNYGVRIQQIVSLQERFRSSTQQPGKAEVIAG